MRIIILISIILIWGCNNSKQTNIENKNSNKMIPEEEQVIQATQDFLVAWNNGDAKTASLFYTEDGVRVGAFGDVQRGRHEIELAYDKLLHQTMPGATVKQERGSVRMLTSDLALWQGSIEIIPSNGDTPLKGYVIQVMKKVNNKWLVLEGHPKLFPQRKN